MMFRILSACALVCALALGAAAQEKQAEAKVSGGERDAAQKIEKAKGTEARLQAAAAFLKKYPQSSLRPQVAEKIAEEIRQTQDNQARATLAQVFLDIFNRPEEAQLVSATLLNAYIDAGRTEEALKLGTEWLAKHPDDIQTMRNLTILASAEAIKGNNAFVQQGRQYGARAIELLESDKMPEGMDAAKWAEFKKSSLVSLYREMGVIAFKSGDNKTARLMFEKAAELRSPDPSVYLLLAQFAGEEYDLRSKEYKIASAADRPAALKTAEAALDRLIEAYARAVAVTDGKAEYQQANAALRQDLETNYKFRNGGKTDGLQRLIDKFKQPAQ